MRRHAFSLMEMLLALALGMIILLALYLAMTTHYFHSQAGRDVVAESTIARNIMSRITNDILGQIGPDDPRGWPDYSAMTQTDPNNPEAMPAADPQAATANWVRFNTGVWGEENVLVLSGSRVQKQRVVRPGEVDEAAATPASDLRRISYWVVTNGSNTVGLARAETKQATSADIDISPTEMGEQEKYVIAPEVKSIRFEFFDGTTWSPSWDGAFSETLDGTAPPLGPPRAIRITLTLRRTIRGQPETASDAEGATYTTTVAVPTSNSFVPYPTSAP